MGVFPLLILSEKLQLIRSENIKENLNEIDIRFLKYFLSNIVG
jgi:hypothetical protein